MTTGAALQDGSIGDVVRVRNSDSGVTVSGAVQPDGSVKVERRMMRVLIVALMLVLIAAPAAAARIKDISVLRGGRDSQLVGYGLVVGLQGSGDTFATRLSPRKPFRECFKILASMCMAWSCATGTSRR